MARVDVEPVDRLREAVALLEHRASFDLVRGALHHREPEHVHAATHPHPIHLEHRCAETRLFR